ncbi:hypothetical protein Acr_14g0000280 [Actinidia rufa]|uniref:Reverse transcriptase Ty1/copia-type domain-containing protein n=1 Tax=Actinidia rufa TaxID=165716 RepID=A0A7J0FNV2_9ERIC|nr:hypothetical protein Acr_14g0000280 [Actinidia rufa]
MSCEDKNEEEIWVSSSMIQLKVLEAKSVPVDVVTVDDLEAIVQLKKILSKKFEIKDLDALKYFLGIEVARSKLTSDYCTFVGGNLVTWRSKKYTEQSLVQDKSRMQDLDRPPRSPLRDLRSCGLEVRMGVCQAKHRGQVAPSCIALDNLLEEREALNSSEYSIAIAALLASPQQNQNIMQQVMAMIAFSCPDVLPSLSPISFNSFMGYLSPSPLPPTPSMNPPYPIEIACLPYTEGYVTPRFSKFNGHNRSVRKHGAQFIKTFGAFYVDKNLKLRVMGSDGVTVLCKIERLAMLQLARENQKPNKGILAYIKRFHDHTMECYEPVEEIQLVTICLDGMQPDYKPLWVNLHFPTFSKLLESKQSLGDSVQLSFSRPHWLNGGDLSAYVIEEMSSQGYKRRRNYNHPPTTLHYKFNEVKATLDKLVEDGKITPRHKAHQRQGH